MRVRIAPNALKSGIAGLSLLSAISVYLFLRLDSPALLQPFRSGLQWSMPGDGLSSCLPSFFYTLSIGILLGIVAKNLSGARLHCLIWIGIALVLELTQHAPIAAWIAGFVADYAPWPLQQVATPYWHRGVFDPLDLVATIAGGMLAMTLVS